MEGVEELKLQARKLQQLASTLRCNYRITVHPDLVAIFQQVLSEASGQQDWVTVLPDDKAVDLISFTVEDGPN